MTAVCHIPFASNASSAKFDIINPITGTSSQELASQSKETYEEELSPFPKFTDGIMPAIIDVEPINDVNEFLPEEPKPETDLTEIYPKTITTEEILGLIRRQKDTYTIIDLKTGIYFNAVRYGGNKHLDTEPKTAADSEKLKSINGNSWTRRAIAVYFKGNFYAASMHTMPHGNGHVSGNNYDGHICVHVTGSKTHGGNRVCEQHQGMVAKSSETNISEILSSIAEINED